MQYSPERNSLPIGTQSFEILRSESSVYVDKTEHIYNLVTGGRVYFLSRPRRFGKSLLISTLEALFKGQRKLFENTWIDGAEYDWAEYPVIRLDMVDINNHDDVDAFKAALKRRMAEIANNYEVDDLPLELDETTCFSHLIKALAKINRVVVLVDEYDKPILENISDEPRAEAMRNILRKLYGILKAQDENLKLVMLTGITKFSKVSVFSGLNNLEDITMVDSFATMLGYTQSELEEVFAPWIERLATEHQLPVQKTLSKLKQWYNGYQFSDNAERVYNPFSTLSVLKHFAFKNYWFKTGTPKYLLDLIKEQSFAPQDLDNLVVRESDLENHDVLDMEVAALLYQTGYLTIKSYNEESRNYKLGYPNFEVDESFTEALFKYFVHANSAARSALIDGLVPALKQCKFDEVFEVLQTFFAAIAYQLHTPSEAYYHSIFYLIFHLTGLRINAEVQSNIGRIDALIELDDRLLIFEFKLDKSAEVALQQIHDKRYYEPYQSQGKEILLLGVNFSSSERNITNWRQEVLDTNK